MKNKRLLVSFQEKNQTMSEHGLSHVSVPQTTSSALSVLRSEIMEKSELEVWRIGGYGEVTQLRLPLETSVVQKNLLPTVMAMFCTDDVGATSHM